MFQRKQQETTRNLQKAKQSTRNQRVVNFSTQFLGSFTECLKTGVVKGTICKPKFSQAQTSVSANKSSIFWKK